MTPPAQTQGDEAFYRQMAASHPFNPRQAMETGQ
jgi:hypothetical protein